MKYPDIIIQKNYPNKLTDADTPFLAPAVLRTQDFVTSLISPNRFVNATELSRHLKNCDPRGLTPTPKAGPKTSKTKHRCLKCQIDFESSVDLQRHLLVVHKRSLLEKNQRWAKRRLLILNIPTDQEVRMMYNQRSWLSVCWSVKINKLMTVILQKAYWLL